MNDGSGRRTRLGLIGRRAEEAIREIGVLLVALTPLDAVVAPTTGTRHILLVLLVAGVLLFFLSVALEWRRRNRG